MSNIMNVLAKLSKLWLLFIVLLFNSQAFILLQFFVYHSNFVIVSTQLNANREGKLQITHAQCETQID